MTVFAPIWSGSLQEINVGWTSDLDGTVVDPVAASLAAQMAFPVSSGDPAHPTPPVTWYAAAWLTGGTGKGFYAQCLAGPTGTVTLAAGKYDVWARVTSPPSAPAVFVGVQTVY